MVLKQSPECRLCLAQSDASCAGVGHGRLHGSRLPAASAACATCRPDSVVRGRKCVEVDPSLLEIRLCDH